MLFIHHSIQPSIPLEEKGDVQELAQESVDLQKLIAIAFEYRA